MSKKTPIQQAIDWCNETEAKIKPKETGELNHNSSPTRIALYGLKKKLESLLPTEEQFAKDAFMEGLNPDNASSNMKYFAKWLPTEGEIKEGDFYIHEGRKEIIECKNLFTKEQTPPYCKLAKLFLCSRDIQVGDIIKDKDDLSQNFELNNEEYLRLYKEKGCTHHFKVIGEISPQATWVKEGNEFDKSEVRWTSFPNKEFEWKVPNAIQILPYEEAKVQIKGPCGHFH